MQRCSLPLAVQPNGTQHCRLGCYTPLDLSGCHVQHANVDCSGASETPAENLPADPKVSSHVDVENRRLKEVTDAIMYELLPAAIATVTQEIDETPQELTRDLCQVCFVPS